MSEAEKLIRAHEREGRYLDVDGLRTFVLDRGMGEPVVLVHGASTSSFMYRKLAHGLAEKGLRAVAIDLPGSGLSGRPREFDYSWTELGRFLDRAVMHLGLDRYHLVVHDIGGPIGFELIAAGPQRVRSVTILNTLLAVDRFSVPLINKPFRVRGLGEVWLASISRMVFSVIAQRILVGDKARFTPAEIEAYFALLKRTDGGAGFLRQMRGFELTEAKSERYASVLRDAAFPVQAIWADRDSVLRIDREGALMRAAIGLAQIEAVPAKHLVADEQAGLLTERIAAFVRRTRNASGDRPVA